jgi:predicted metal-dependent HD superfamily phosphohydrolase
MLAQIFKQLCQRYRQDDELADELWFELVSRYSEEGRYYHTLTHLSDLYFLLQELRSNIRVWDTVLFSLFYHDAIYDPLKQDNEERSGDLAARRLRELNVPEETILGCMSMIHATKSHQQALDGGVNLFTDADLAILGQSGERYRSYTSQIRMEYSMYPDAVYNSGRSGVLKHFLSMNRIYKTEAFRERYEDNARLNMKQELISLS